MLKLFFWAINLLIFLIPAYLFRFKVAGLPTNFFEICFLSIFIWWIFKKGHKGRKKIKGDFMLIFHQFINQNCLLFFGINLLLIGISLSIVFSSDTLVSLGILKSWFIIPIMLAWVTISTFSENLKLKTQNSKLKIPNSFYHSVSLFRPLAFSGLIVALTALGYLLRGNLTYDGRLKAFFEHPNHLAMYLAPCWLVTYGLFVQRTTGLWSGFITTRKTEKKLWLSSLILISIPIFFTYSYGAWMGIMAGILFILWRLKRKNKDLRKISRKRKKWPYGFRAFTTLMIFMAIFALVVSTQINNPKLQNVFTTQRSSIHSRLMIWRSASRVLQDNWFLGIGPGMFQEHYLNYQKYFPPYLEWAVPQPHNIFLAFWLQTGIIGFIGFILILIWFFRRGLKAIHKISKNKKEALMAYGPSGYYVLILMAIMIYFLVHGLFDTPYWKNDLSIMFWMIIGLMSTVSHPNYLQRKENPPCQKR